MQAGESIVVLGVQPPPLPLLGVLLGPREPGCVKLFKSVADDLLVVVVGSHVQDGPSLAVQEAVGLPNQFVVELFGVLLVETLDGLKQVGLAHRIINQHRPFHHSVLAPDFPL